MSVGKFRKALSIEERQIGILNGIFRNAMEILAVEFNDLMKRGMLGSIKEVQLPDNGNEITIPVEGINEWCWRFIWQFLIGIYLEERREDETEKHFSDFFIDYDESVSYSMWYHLNDLFSLLNRNFYSTTENSHLRKGTLFNRPEHYIFESTRRVFYEFHHNNLSISNETIIQLFRCFYHAILPLKIVEEEKKPINIDYSTISPLVLGVLYQRTLEYRLVFVNQKGNINSISLREHRLNRKSGGIFYTKSELIRPTVERTLKPHIKKINDFILSSSNILKVSKEISNLKIVDPAMGTGAFLAAALHRLSDVFAKSMYVCYGSLETKRDILLGSLFGQDNCDESFKLTIIDHLSQSRSWSSFFCRLIADNCLFGVDIDPVAVELSRIFLWIDISPNYSKYLIDQHFKVGNALVGAWNDQLAFYPLHAWDREGGDKRHKNGVHFSLNSWSEAIVKKRTKILKYKDPDEYLKYRTKTDDLKAYLSDSNDKMLAAKLDSLKTLSNKWCSLWFWPPEQIELIPSPCEYFKSGKESDEVVKSLVSRLKFFHWELEYTEIFLRDNPGFDVVIGNPPWEIFKPSSKEFFSRYDYNYRNYSKQDALRKQTALFLQNRQIEREWIQYLSSFKALSNWIKWIGRYRPQTFHHQGKADLNSYKMFLEVMHTLICSSGRFGALIPAGIYTDEGSKALRELFLTEYRWEWLYAFENRKRIFPIHRSFKFCVIILTKGQKSSKIKVAFMRHHLDDWLEPRGTTINYPLSKVKFFSPRSFSFLEFMSTKDLEVIDRLYMNSSLLMNSHGEKGWNIAFSREFDMTNDSKHFILLESLRMNDETFDIFGRWFDSNQSLLLPLYEGRMIGPFDFSQKGWKSGKGRRAEWFSIPFSNKHFVPQYLVSASLYDKWSKAIHTNKIAFINVTASTNNRTMIASIVPDYPCGNATPVITTKGGSLIETLLLTAILNSFCYDFIVRIRCAGLNLNFFLLQETPLPLLSNILPVVRKTLAIAVARLNFIHDCFASQWLELRNLFPELGCKSWRDWWIVEEVERRRMMGIIDALVAFLYDITEEDYMWILRDNEDNPKGFWRVDKGLETEFRQPTIALAAYQRLRQAGITHSCQNVWNTGSNLISEEICLRTSWLECERLARKFSRKKRISRKDLSHYF